MNEIMGAFVCAFALAGSLYILEWIKKNDKIKNYVDASFQYGKIGVAKNEIDLELKNKNIKFIWDKNIPEGIINIDEIRIYQAVFNLISNSMKYSNGNLTINFKSYIENRYLFIYIQDNGVGISLEDMPYIFNKFYRGDKSRNSRIQGSGLGLSTCKYIVEKHGGEIYCKSLRDSGSTFYFTIPIA